MFKERDNKDYLGPVTGTVISTLPELKVSVGDKVILDHEHLIVGQSVLTSIQSGDEVILVPTQDEQTYFLLDKAVRLL